jgi:hypothetical protein
VDRCDGKMEELWPSGDGQRRTLKWALKFAKFKGHGTWDKRWSRRTKPKNLLDKRDLAAGDFKKGKARQQMMMEFWSR